MTSIWRFAALIFGPGALLCLALVGYSAVDAYLLGNCDPKFGCAGGVQVSAFVTGLALLCSLVGNLLACSTFNSTVRFVRLAWLLGAVVVLSLGQGALFASSGRFLPGDSLQSMMVAWAGLSALLALVALAVVRHWAPNNSFKPTPLRGAA
ncbi:MULTISPECIES: hypothetical protein [unclassified Luteimonas]